MSKKRPARLGNPDLRHRTQIAAPPVEVVERKLWQGLNPASWNPLKNYVFEGKPKAKLRERSLTLPVIMAIILSLVYRKMPGLSEVIRVLQQEGLFGLKPLKVSKQALSKRLRKLPIALFVEPGKQLLLQLQSESDESHRSNFKASEEKLASSFSVIWIADGSTLEAIRKKLKVLQEQSGKLLGGKMMAVVCVLTHQPVTYWYTEEGTTHDYRFSGRLLEILPPGGLLIFDLGFWCFAWFDQFTEQKKFFLTRLKSNTAYRTVRCLSQGTHYRDEIISMGMYRSNPCQHPVRLVSVLWGANWYHYVTNVLDDSLLPPQQVCELYRRRWRVEDAFAITKRLLDLSYLWVGHSNGVEIQMLATWMIYAVVNQICLDVAVALKQPLEQISVEMVFRSLSHFAVAFRREPSLELIPYLTENARLFGLVKARRKRHRQIDAYTQLVWSSTA